MIADRIRRALTALLYSELASLFLTFSLCYFAFYGRLTQVYSTMPYQPKTLIFFFVMVFVVGLLSASAHFLSEVRSFITHYSISLIGYRRTSLIIQLTIGGSGATVGFFLFSAWAGFALLVYTLLLGLIYLPSARLVANLLDNAYDSPQHRLNVLLVGINRRSDRFYHKMSENTRLGINVAGFVDEARNKALEAGKYLGKPDDIEDIIRKHDINLILFFLPMRSYYDTCNKMVHKAESLGVATHAAGNLFERSRQQVNFLSGVTGMNISLAVKPGGDKLWQSLYRAGDITVSVLIPLATWPVILPICACIMLGGGSPIVTGSETVGKEKQIFRLYRFRTTRGQSLDEDQGDIPGGKVFRALHLDTLPRAINLALGELTLFGPKPLSPAEFDALPPEEQELYAASKPGLLG